MGKYNTRAGKVDKKEQTTTKRKEAKKRGYRK
jgi:hypothetical protein